MTNASMKDTIRGLIHLSLADVIDRPQRVNESTDEVLGISPQEEPNLLMAQVGHLKKAREHLLQAQVELAMASEDKVRNKLPKLVKDLQATIVIINK